MFHYIDAGSAGYRIIVSRMSCMSRMSHMSDVSDMSDKFHKSHKSDRLLVNPVYLFVPNCSA